MPTGDVWGQFPVVAIIVAVLALIGGGFFTFAKWVWSEFKAERDKDQAWREQQNAKREAAQREQNQAWQQTVTELAERWEKQDMDRNRILTQIVEATQAMLKKLDEHDERAERIEQYTRPRRTAK